MGLVTHLYGVAQRLLRRLFPSRLGKIALAIVPIWFAFGPDYFGSADNTERMSRQMVDRLRAFDPPATPSDRISVVLVRHDTFHAPALGDRQESWPPSFAFWSELLDSLFQRSPHAVFLDVVLGVDRPPYQYEDSPALSLRDLAQTHDGDLGSRLVLAEDGTTAIARWQAHLRTRKAASLDARTAVQSCQEAASTPGCLRTSLSPSLADVVPVDRRAFINWDTRLEDPRQYPLFETYGESGPGGRKLPPLLGRMPATVLASMACSSGGPLSSAPPSWCTSGEAPSQSGAGPLDWLQIPKTAQDPEQPPHPALLPRWSVYGEATIPDTAQDTDLTTAACTHYPAEQANSFFRRTFRKVGIALLSALPAFDDLGTRRFFDLPAFSLDGRQRARPTDLPCWPFPVIFATDLLRPVSAADEEALGNALRNRLVLVGTALENSGDTIVSPLHGTVPGVFLHAVALDTMLATGRQFPARPDDRAKGWAANTEKVVKSGIVIASTFAILFPVLWPSMVAALLLALGALLLPALLSPELLAPLNVADLMQTALVAAGTVIIDAAKDRLVAAKRDDTEQGL